MKSTWYGLTNDGVTELSPINWLRYYQGSSLFVLDAGAPSNPCPLNGTFRAIRFANHQTTLSSIDLLLEMLLPQKEANLHVSADNSNADLSFENLVMSPSFASALVPFGRANKAALDCMQSDHSRQFQQLPEIAVRQAVKSTMGLFSLNEDQQVVLRSVAAWFTEVQTANVLLVRGVFGSGKSFLLAAICVFLKLCDQYASNNSVSDTMVPGSVNRPPLSTLISSNTNVAVDRILSILVSMGPVSCLPVIARVGCVLKIDKQLRPYLLSTKDHKPSLLRDIAVAAKQTNNQSPGEGDDTVLQELLAQVKQPDFAVQQKQLLKLADVVGVTCASAGSPVLCGKSFQLCILDEASQMTEPLSLLPLARAKCCKMIVVGDPMQLPPTLVAKQPSPTAAAGEDSCWLGTTLFDRLMLLGHPMITLRTQYRCHPDISGICRCDVVQLPTYLSECQ
jgi:hypothetical protein